MLPAMEQPTITSAYRSVGITFDSLVFKSAVMRECLRLAPPLRRATWRCCCWVKPARARI